MPERRKAVILAGGMGTRLHPLTLYKSKPLMDFCNEPAIAHQLRALKGCGISCVVLPLADGARDSEATFRAIARDVGIGVDIYYESVPLNTAGPLALVRESLRGCGNFLVLNCDVFCEFPLREMWEAHVQMGGEVTLAVTKSTQPWKYGVVVRGRNEAGGRKGGIAGKDDDDDAAAERMAKFVVIRDEKELADEKVETAADETTTTVGGIAAECATTKKWTDNVNSAARHWKKAKTRIAEGKMIVNDGVGDDDDDARENGFVAKFVEKPSEFVGDEINAGIYIFSEKVLERLEERPISLDGELLPEMAARGEMRAFKLTGFWMDIGQPEDYLKGTAMYLNWLMKRSSSLMDKAETTILVHKTARIGTGCMIGSNVVIGPGVTIADEASITNATVLDGSYVGKFARVENSIIGWNSSVGYDATLENVVLGEGVVVEDHVSVVDCRVQPGERVGASVVCEEFESPRL